MPIGSTRITVNYSPMYVTLKAWRIIKTYGWFVRVAMKDELGKHGNPGYQSNSFGGPYRELRRCTLAWNSQMDTNIT